MGMMSGAQSEGTAKVRRKRMAAADAEGYVHYGENGKDGKDGKGVGSERKDGAGREGLDAAGIAPILGDGAFAAPAALPVARSDGGDAVAAVRAGGTEMLT